MNGRGKRGLLITLEGIDGSGKSTQAVRLARWLREMTGREVIRTFEPGDWPGGPSLRSLLLAGNIPDDRTELLLFLADRSGHLASSVMPALEEGKIVLCERYSDSTWAYQKAGRGLQAGFVEGLVRACSFPDPDLTVFLRISPETAVKRVESRGGRDRIEAEGFSFMLQVTRGYDELAEKEPERFLVVAGDGPEDEVFALLRGGVLTRLGELL